MHQVAFIYVMILMFTMRKEVHKDKTTKEISDIMTSPLHHTLTPDELSCLSDIAGLSQLLF